MNTYDYIVIGSGPAGSVMARTLSDGGASVLLLEAGESRDSDPLLMDANSNLYAHIPEYFWPGESMPQAQADGRSFALTGGRVAGGGSSVNGEMYVRPTPHVLREWARIGGPQWSPQEVQRRFVELERFHGTMGDAHGGSGRLHIRQAFAQTSALLEKMVGAFAEGTGFATVDDYNHPDTPIGAFSRWQLYQKPDGTRASASVCFLPGGNSLTCLYKSTATRILLEGGRATGVMHLTEGEMRTSHAGQGVILCAGLGSAKLLMLSGIGPERVLREAGIPVAYANENVGQHLADDAYAGVAFTINPADAQGFREADPNGKFVGGAFLPAPLAGASPDARAIQFIPTLAGPDTVYMSMMCVNARSRGSLRIQNNDPFTILRGDFGFLTDPYDMQVLMAAMRTYITGVAKALQKIDPAYALAAPTLETIADDDRLAAYIRGGFKHTYHDQGQLRMGTERDGAVDGFGAVHGVGNLTVADASIIPYHMDGNTSASAYVIGYTIARHLLGAK